MSEFHPLLLSFPRNYKFEKLSIFSFEIDRQFVITSLAATFTLIGVGNWSAQREHIPMNLHQENWQS